MCVFMSLFGLLSSTFVLGSSVSVVLFFLYFGGLFGIYVYLSVFSALKVKVKLLFVTFSLLGYLLDAMDHGESLSSGFVSFFSDWLVMCLLLWVLLFLLGFLSTSLICQRSLRGQH